jgi:hypothetical protein
MEKTISTVMEKTINKPYWKKPFQQKEQFYLKN